MFTTTEKTAKNPEIPKYLRMHRTLVMGVLNVTPNSFSDGGKWFDVAAAIDHGRAMLAAGADIVDVGGESTAPGNDPIDPRREIQRVVPVIGALAGEGALISSTPCTLRLPGRR